MKIKSYLLFISIFTCLTFNTVNILAQTKTIVAFGDSVTAPRKNVITYSDVIREEFKKKSLDVKVINSGVGGNTTEMAKLRFEKDVLAHKPDVAIIQLGTNDAAIDVWKTPPATESRVAIDVYEKNIRDFIKALKKQNSKIILVIPPPKVWTKKLLEMYGKPPFDPNHRDGFNIILRKYNEVLRKIAKSENIPSIDVFEVYQQYDKVEGQLMDNLFLDGLHPNTEGHKVIAGLLVTELKKLKLGL